MSSSEAQGDLWGARAQDWAEIQEAGALPLYESVADGLGVDAETRLLDVGCGAGRFCLNAAEAGTAVAGIDASAALIAIARERVPDGDFRVGDMEQLPFDDGAFDLVTALNSLQFAGDPVGALREAARVVHPEGRIAAAVWGRPEDCEGSVVRDALAPFLPEPAAGLPAPFALSEEGALAGLVERAGLRAGKVHEVPCPWVYPDLGTAIRGLASAGPAALAERAIGREAVEQAIAEVLQPFQDALTGIYRLENVFQYLVATPA